MMQSNTTKYRITEAATHLFNELGVANVRLQQIADDAGISVGNLAYHFKNKEAIVVAVYDMLFDEFSVILSQYLQNRSLVDFDRQLEQYHAFFSKYQFYLIDLFEVERSYPATMKRWRDSVTKMMLQLRKRLDYFVQHKLLITEPSKGVYDTLANNIWMSIVFWIPQQVLKGQSFNAELFKEAVWLQIHPYFTLKGLEEFQVSVQPLINAG